MSTSSVAKDLAAKVTPPIRADVASRKQEIVRAASPAPVRMAISVGFPVLLQEVPTLIETSCDALLDLFGAMTIAEVAERLIQHNESKGRNSHLTLSAFVQRSL